MTDAQDLEVRWAQYRAAIAKANGLNKDAVFDALSAAGITKFMWISTARAIRGRSNMSGTFAGERAWNYRP